MDQLSLYVENKKGTSRAVLAELSRAQVNVLGFVNNDSGEFSTIRMILSDLDKGCDVLKKIGYLCKKSKVLGVELKDVPGSLGELLTAYEEMNINIDYMYVGYRRENATPIIILHSDAMDIVEERLKQLGYQVY